MTEKEKVISKHQRKIRSYVRREGRFTPAQRSAYESYWPDFGIDVTNEKWNFSAIFGRQSDVFLELGFGDGTALKTLASRHPENDYVGIEVHRPGVGRLMRELHAEEINNVRVSSEDGTGILKDNIPLSSLSGISIFFPDPWHKKKHNKRRMIQQEFTSMAASRLKPGGVMHLATDWQDYAEQMLEVLTAEPLLENTSPGKAFIERPDSRPLTKYEQRGLRLGHGVWDLVFRRKAG
ncbi:MAG: tRNA (guanosine(46)-N7)-methyltransferase TrmB [Pseudomonadota bacterium]|nr:tRNA (guanosine(46)-N7)-methyltransferase TrmB [Pseudomonadota bacterium]